MSSEPTSTSSSFWTTPRRVVGGTAVVAISTGAGFFGKWIGSACNGQWGGGGFGPVFLSQSSDTTSPPSCRNAEIGFSTAFAGATIMLLSTALLCIGFFRCPRSANTNVETAVRANAITRSSSGEIASLDEKAPLVNRGGR